MLREPMPRQAVPRVNCVRTLPDERLHPTSIRLTPSQRDGIEAAVKREGGSVSTWIQHAIEFKLGYLERLREERESAA